MIKASTVSKILLANILIVLILIVVADVVLTKFNLVKLIVRMGGHQEIGWVAPVHKIRGRLDSPEAIHIAFLGDSHHLHFHQDRRTHQSMILSNFLESHGTDAIIYSLGVGGYSPLQELIAYESSVKDKEDIDYAVFLLYAGNDFSDTLRRDDRPWVDFAEDGKPYLRKPQWIRRRASTAIDDHTQWPRDSRFLYFLNSFVGRSDVLLRVMVANRGLDALDVSLQDRIRYIQKVYKFKDDRLSYSGAIAAQFLNQYYIYNQYRSKFREEVEKRLVYFFREFRRLNPDTKGYVFFLPSSPAIDAMNIENEKILAEILERNNLQGYDFTKLEHELFDLLIQAEEKAGSGIEIHDLSGPISDQIGSSDYRRYYDRETIHIDTPARRIVGEEIGRVLLEDIERSRTPPSRQP